MTIRALIVDDEPIARRGIRQRLRAMPDVEVVGECGDGATATASIAELAPDLVFLDVQMPEVGGFDVIDAIGVDRLPALIFVTAFDHYAVRAFEVHAVDYLLKPVDDERFRQAMERAREQVSSKSDVWGARIRAALADLGHVVPARWCRRLAIKSPGRVRFVDIDEVDWAEAAGNYVEVHTGQKSHLLRETMASLEQRLDPGQFARVSRAAIVNVNAVRELQPMFNGDFVVILRDGSVVSGSRRYREPLFKLLG